jgi:acrylyl-CoA reductase (NADPH)
MEPFRVLRIRDKAGTSSAAIEMSRLEELDPGELVLRVAYSCVNYKDALAATGAGKVVRRFPCIGGIDLAGTVLESADPRFRRGDAVIATSFDLGVSHDGGYTEVARVPAAWAVPMPKGMTLFESMALGTAGYTAGLAVERMEHNGLSPERGPVVVTGATGGVGSIAIDILAGLGYEVVALTGKQAEEDYLKDLGAARVMFRQELDLANIRPLGKATWAGAVDNLGGDVLAWVASTMQQGGTIACIGLAASPALTTTVAPFIFRGASLLGIDSGYTVNPVRTRVWERLAGEFKPRHLAGMTRTIGLSELPGVFQDFLDARVRGRIVVDMSE